jgi:hypothetical protein
VAPQNESLPEFSKKSNSGYAVAICAASSKPISLMEISRILYFWVLPLMVKAFFLLAVLLAHAG